MINDPEYIDKMVGKIKEIPEEEIVAAVERVDLEEDMKLLEENIKNGTIYVHCGYSVEKALKNLIKKHNELQEEFFWQQIRIRNEHVPISMVKDKIDEYAKRRKELADGNFFADQSYINNDTALVIGMSVLEDLIKERKKQNEL